jgi:hypothetical protein
MVEVGNIALRSRVTANTFVDECLARHIQRDTSRALTVRQIRVANTKITTPTLAGSQMPVERSSGPPMT